MSDASNAALEVAAVLLVLVTVLWIALGRRPRAFERADERRRRGGRPPRQGRWLPARDRTVTPYGLLAVLAATDLAHAVIVAAEGGAARPALLFGAVVAAGFGVAPGLTGASLGVLGSAFMVFDRLGGLGCAEEVPLGLTVLWALLSVLLVTWVITLRIITTPIRPAARVARGVGRTFLTSPGGARPVGSPGRTLLVLFGILSVLDLALRPTAASVLRWNAGDLSSLALLVLGIIVMVTAFAILPEFTASVVALGAGVAGLSLRLLSSCYDSSLLWLCAASFLGVTWLTRRLAWPCAAVR